MKKIKVRVCLGTTCYLMGGSEFTLLDEYLPADVMEKVEIEGATCLGACSYPKMGRPPFVEVNGRIIAEATIQKLVDIVKEEV